MFDRACDPPQPVQVISIYGDWLPAVLIGWRKDTHRGWLAVIVHQVPAGHVRPPRSGAASHRPDGGSLHRRADRRG